MSQPSRVETVERSSRRRKVRWLAVVALFALLAGACGSSGRSTDASSTDEPAGGDTGQQEPSGQAMFGDLPSPCGDGDASGATAQGVTDTEITIGYGDDAGYQAAPGTNRQMSDAVKALIQWCNDQGGINGRQVVGNYYDAAITEANNAMTEACGQVFMMVGEGFAFDGAGEQTRVACGLPMVPGYAVNPSVTMGPDVFMPIPVPIDMQAAENAAAMAEAFPEQVKKAASVFSPLPATVESKDRAEAAYSQLGWNFVGCDQQYAITGEADWKPIAQALKDCGAEVVYFTGAAHPNFENLLDAAGQVGYEPLWAVEGNFYEASFGDWNVNGLADNVYLRGLVVPFNQADDNPATKQYIDLVEGSGGDISTLGVQAASAFLMWATVAKDCGSDLTRECMVDGLSKITSWTGGGLHVETNPGENIPSECGMTIKMDGTEFNQWRPEEIGEFDCSPDYIRDIEVPAAEEAQVGPDRKAHIYTG